MKKEADFTSTLQEIRKGDLAPHEEQIEYNELEADYVILRCLGMVKTSAVIALQMHSEVVYIS